MVFERSEIDLNHIYWGSDIENKRIREKHHQSIREIIQTQHPEIYLKLIDIYFTGNEEQRGMFFKKHPLRVFSKIHVKPNLNAYQIMYQRPEEVLHIHHYLIYRYPDQTHLVIAN